MTPQYEDEMIRYLFKIILDFNEKLPEGFSNKLVQDESIKTYKKRAEYVLIQ